jgi:Dock homology region 2
MEDQMVEEAETAGELFLSAGIIGSSRFAWSLATQYYAQKFNYSKLAIAYGNLARTVVSRVPPIDASLPQEVSAVLGRFYRVWFHGGAPDELSGVEFVYRTEGSVRLDQFGQDLKEVIKSIIPDNTPIHLVLDGKVDQRLEDNPSAFALNRLGPTPLEPVRIKVTPLRPLFGSTNMRGHPEWFYRYADEAFTSLHHRSKNELDRPTPRSISHTDDVSDPHHHNERSKSFSATVFSSTGSSTGGGAATRAVGFDTRASRFTALSDGELSGVDKFCFLQPKDRSKGSKEWWRNPSDFAEKALKVTQLQVAQSFPACVARQAVVHRLVYSQSPLEAGVDAVCQWNAVLFRTAVATIGLAVLGTNTDPGIGTEAVKVVADCSTYNVFFFVPMDG